MEKREWGIDTCTVWMNVENFMQWKEISHKGPQMVWFHLYEMSIVANLYKQISFLGLGEEWWEWGVTANEIEKVLTSIVMVVIQSWKYIKNHWIVHFIWVNYISLKLLQK